MNDLTVKEALPGFYDLYNLEPEGGINDSYVKIELLKGAYLYIPNFDTRKKILLRHDIHHILTGYSANMKGETEISAWEISTGCLSNWVAFTLNTYGIMAGVLFNLPGVWKAWLRGKHSRNLYQEKYKNEYLLIQKIGDLKKELRLSEGIEQKQNLFISLLSFGCFLVFGAVFSIFSFVLFPFILLYSLFITLRKLWKKS